MKQEDLEQALLNAMNSGRTEDAALIKGVIDRSFPLTAKGGAKAFASGMAKTLGDVLVGAGSAEAGPTMLMPGQQAAGIQGQEQAARQASANLGGDRLPLNTGERYLKSAGEGALPLPGPMMATGAVSGALGGLGAQWTREKNLGPVAELAAWMTPAFLASLGKSTMPGTPYKDIRRALGSTTPEDSTAMVRRMQDAEALGVDLMPWQAAPEGSGLNTFGKGMSLNPDAEQMQFALRQQTGQTGQPWVKAKTDPNFEALNQVPIAPDQAQSMRDALRGVVAKRSLHPASADAKAVENAAAFFGKEAPGDVVAFVNQLQQEVSKAVPGSPEYRAAIAKLMAAASGQLPPPPVFKPEVRNVGQALSAKQQIRSGNELFSNAIGGTRSDLRQLIDEALSGTPGYKEALTEYGKAKTVAEIVAEGQALKGRHVTPNVEKEARTSVGTTIPYAIATNVAWALVPPIRKVVSQAVARELDAALASRDLAALERLAGRNPQIEAAMPILGQLIRGDQTLPKFSPSKMAEDALKWLPSSKGN